MTVELVKGSQATLTSTEGSVADGAYDAATTDISTATNNTNNYSLGEFVLSAAWTTAPTSGTFVYLYAQPQNIQSTNDAPVPDANFQHYLIGQFPVDNVGSSTTMYLQLLDIFAPINFDVATMYIRNETDQTIDSGWNLYVFGPKCNHSFKIVF